MNTRLFRPLAAAFTALTFFSLPAPCALAQSTPQQPSLAVTRITQPVDESRLVTLKGNVVPQAQAQFDRGAAPVSMPTGRIMLVLKGSLQQQNAKQQYLDALQDPASPSYHKWLTPAQYGQLYGPTEQDIQTVTAWLQSQGFSVDKVSPARNMIEFSGSVGQVQQAFHTAIHSFVIGGQQHYANIGDPRIPAALAPVVAGVASLNDFHPRAGAIRGPSGHFDAQSKTIKPDLTLHDNSGNNFLYVDPADAATIYDTPSSTLNRNYTGTSYDGSGITIGIAGDSNINPSDVGNYRTAFLNEPTPKLPNVIVDGNDPGLNGDEVEALLDTEVAGGLAPGATIDFYTAANTDFQSGLFLAIYRALNDNTVSILNVSFGACEAVQGAAGNAQILAAWQQAAAQGISVTVSTGDSGSAACDNPNVVTTATQGLAVSGLASTPYDIAVGGTDYDALLSSSTSFAQYVDISKTANKSPYYGTALGYIPEEPWNNSTIANTTIAANTPFKDSNGNTNIVGAGGGVSSDAVCNFSIDPNTGNCLGKLVAYPKPAFQTSLTPNDNVRDLPDVSLLASNGTYNATWVVCLDPSLGTGSPNPDCQVTGGTLTSNSSFSGVGGTSASAPAFAGMLALVAQSQMAQGKSPRLGQADTVLYALAKATPAIFHDVTAGNNSVYCGTPYPQSYTGTGPPPNCGSNSFLSGYQAGPGYDLASGLGSVDMAKLVSNWSSVSFTATTTSLQAGTSTSSLGTGTIAVKHGTPVDFSATVAPGAATGTVTIETDSTLPNQGLQVALKALSGGTAIGSYNGLPGGQYNLYGYYSGDTSYAASKSNSIPVNISPEDSTTALTVGLYDATTGRSLGNGITTAPYGSYVYVDAQPYGNASTKDANGNIVPDGIPTGTVTFLNGTTAIATTNINSQGVADYNGTGPLSPGNYSFTAQYSGDAGLNPSTSSAAAITITQAQTAMQVTPASSTIQSNGSATLTATVTTTSVANPPTGSITFKSGSTVIGTVALNSTNTGTLGGFAAAQVQFPVPGSSLAAGSNTINIAYSGDANYAASSTSSTVTVSGTTTGGGLGIAGTNVTIAAPGQSGTSTVTVTPTNGFTGVVNLTCAVQNPLGTASPPTCSFAANTVTITNTSPQTATMNIATTTQTASTSFPFGKFLTGAGGTALAFAFFFGIPARRRKWQAMLGLLIVLVSIAGIGCGSGSSSHKPQTFTATVTGTDAATGKITATASITITVQ